VAERQRQNSGTNAGSGDKGGPVKAGLEKAGLEKAGLEDVGERVLVMQTAIDELVQTITNLKYDVDTADKKVRALEQTLRTTQGRVQTHLGRIEQSKA